MAERSFPFASVSGDRKYTDQNFRDYFAALVTTGVLPVGTQLQVQADSGMNLLVSVGTAFVQGAMYQIYTGAQSITLDTADGALGRIDRVVVRYSRTDRRVYVTALAGTPGSTPAAPDIVRDADYYDLSLATASVAAGATEIAQADITDTRADTDVCGFASSLITPETTGWFDQFTDAWNTWFDAIKGQLSEDAATNLYNTKYDKPLRFADTAVAAEAWVADATYADYGYKADITLSGVTADMVPDVVLPLSIAISGDVAPVAICGAGYVRIYASAAQAAMTIPTITVWKAV